MGQRFGPVTAKYSYPVTDFFSAPDSKGSSYLDLGFGYDVGSGFGINAHYGYQTLKGGAVLAQMDGSTPDNISDWKLGVTYGYEGWTFGLAYVATNRDYTAGTAALSNKNISGQQGVLNSSNQET